MVTITYPVAPTTTVLKGRLLDAATVDSQFAWHDGRDLFDSYNCMSFGAEADFCAPNVKDLDNAATWQQGFRFAAYGGITCQRIGLDVARAESEVRRVFEAGESTAIERAFMERRFRVGPLDGQGVPLWTAPVDITPVGGPVSPAAGVALLEGFAGSEYVGVPTIHVPRTVASLILGADGAEFDGQVLNTKLGSKIAAGVGYDFPNTGPTGAAAAEGEKWLYATGEVFLSGSDLMVRQAFAEQDNEVVVLAERGYVGAVDCFAAAIRVSIG